MKLFRRLSVILFAVVILCTVLSLTASAADGKVTASSAKVKAGDQITVDITLSDNPGIAYLKLEIGYDTDALSLVECSNGGVLSGMFVTSKTIDVHPYVLTWTNASNMTKSGVIASLTFQVKDNAAPGEHAISVIIGEATSQTFDSVALTAVNGSVAVLGKACAHAHTETIPAVAATCTKTGLTEGKKCSDCGAILQAQSITPKAAHTEVTVPGKEPTCKNPGLQDGLKCSVCGTVTKYNVEIPALGHSYENGRCTRCGEVEPHINPFLDVKSPSKWFYEAVYFVSDRGIMNGIGENRFAPNAEMDRAQLCQVIFNYDHGAAEPTDNPPTDVPARAWYRDAVLWAYQQNIVYGVDAIHFAPTRAITRQEICSILYRFLSQRRGITADGTVSDPHYSDEDKIAAWAKESVFAMRELGLISGIPQKDGSYHYEPLKTATRAEIASVMMRLVQLEESRQDV